MVHICDRCNKPFKKLWILTHHLQNRKFLCRPQIIPIINPIPIPQTEPDTSLIENDAVLDTGIHFIQIRVSDPERPHDNFKLLSNWEAIVPSPILDPRYEFIKPIIDPVKYAEMPYMPLLLANARDEITRVLKIELNEKDQIKTALIAHCYYAKSKKKEDM
ncbi:9684_t:CDS:2, partial [Ambispora leptoticha]